MSHNKLKVAGQSPNISSEVSVALTNLSDIGSTPSNEDTNEWSARTVFAGTTYALANQDIADNGGEFVVINGRVAVGESTGCGIISPLPHGGSTRTEGDLVMIHIR